VISSKCVPLYRTKAKSLLKQCDSLEIEDSGV
jgi:hypothetical protein